MFHKNHLETVQNILFGGVVLFGKNARNKMHAPPPLSCRKILVPPSESLLIMGNPPGCQKLSGAAGANGAKGASRVAGELP